METIDALCPSLMAFNTKLSSITWVNSRNFSGWSVKCTASSTWLKVPLVPRKGIQAMVRMMPGVQNGMAQSRNSTVRMDNTGP